jgi:hypothetical protein
MFLNKFLVSPLKVMIRNYKTKTRMLEIKRKNKQQTKRKNIALKHTMTPFMMPEIIMKEKKVIIYKKISNEKIDLDEASEERNRGEEAL